MISLEETLTTSPKLIEILNNIEIFNQSIPEDSCIAIFDTEKVIGYLHGDQIDLKLQVGTPIEDFKGTVTYKVLEVGRTLREERDAEKFGVSYTAIAIPLFENGKIVGVFTSVVSNEKSEILQKGGVELSAMVQEMSATTEQVTQASNDVASSIQEISAQTEELNGNIQNIDSILKFIQDIASMSHLLGLNAAIEAARAGENGKGFSVVASEIRKMGDQSKNAVNDIQERIDLLTNTIKQINHSIHQIASFTEEHSASMEELNTTFEQISLTTEKFMNVAILEA
ncbi:methyl-accepting chemotaxis protein [Neobacillus sp. PS3-40]|uniref:methyl-accepting chemotaxis protein n=1 Tax=Neobacillus sp. PS3-40 TaxID=3070679 RepID=UPI0027DEEA45|nr:methyl-accepting chemotaxis protein [Neobacillus sp. PS3-40]WML43951.1 methyl-accepting chemotaxis protein [Neobacillus sp. PS3-40]